MTMQIALDIADLNVTETLGRRLGRELFPGAVIALNGQLGAGKTHFTRAIAEGLEITNPALVTSPTFVLIQEYPARLPIYHFDAYRLANSELFRDLGSDEYFHGDGVSIVEWAERVSDALPNERLEVQIEVVDENRRRFHFTATSERYEQVMKSLRSIE